MTLGSYANAKLAYKIIDEDLDEPSWKMLNSGSTRTAILAPDGYVYKVPHRGESWYNLHESEQARRLRGQKRLEMLDVVIPKVRTYNIGKDDYDDPVYVNCMEYIKPTIQAECNYEYDAECNCRYWGQSRICFGILFERLEAFGIEDMFYGNVHYGEDGKFYIIDLGA